MIFTGYYAKTKTYKELGLEPVAISGKVPDFFEGTTYPDFAPRWEMFKRWKAGEITNEGYVKEYKAYLNTLNKDDIEFDFKEYNTEKNHCVLLCYEKPHDFCHRHVLADWLEENFGWKIAEYYVGGDSHGK